jgi:putative transposase
MPRKPREEEEGAVAHVFARGNDHKVIFRDDADRRTYLVLLGIVVEDYGWRCLGYCQMSNHVHLIIETPRANLGRGMQALHGPYATTFNRRHGRINHLFGSRYGAKRIRTDEHLWAAASYIALNPVEAHLVVDPAAWEWSSHAAVLGLRAAPRWLDVPRLLAAFEGFGRDPRQRYRAMVTGRRELMLPGPPTRTTTPDLRAA